MNNTFTSYNHYTVYVTNMHLQLAPNTVITRKQPFITAAISNNALIFSYLFDYIKVVELGVMYTSISIRCLL